MELMTLDDQYRRPDLLIESYSSLIWSERYATNGDFQLLTYNVEETLNRMPLECWVAIRESTVPMIVEQHKITKGKNKAPVLEIKGRSVETILERRAAVNEIDSDELREAWMMEAASESDAAYMAIREVIGDVLRDGDPLGYLDYIDPAIDPKDAFDGIDLPLPADFDWDFANTYEIKAQNLYKTVLELLAVNHHGIKAVREDNDGFGTALEIYNGANRTGTGPPSDFEPVVFNARFDQFDEATYLLSKQGSTNVSYIYGPNGAQIVLKTTPDVDHPEPSGFERRVLLNDLSAEPTMSTSEVRTARALIDLYNFNQTALFDGAIAQQVAEGFNSQYFLGDLLRLDGEYGLSQNVRVAEFIRTEDATGEKAYPTFEAIDDMSGIGA